MKATLPMLDRRQFLKTTSLAGGGLAIGLSVVNRLGAEGAPGADVFVPNALIQLHADGRIVLISKSPEIGQGIKTSLPMVIAEELDVPWESVQVEQGDLRDEYGWQGAGGSWSTPGNYQNFRILGAAARLMLVRAAAEIWQVSESDCTTAEGAVHHKASGRTLRYSALVAKAATLPVPDEKTVKPKDPANFKLLGRRITGVDNAKLVAGEGLFGIDVRLPGMVYAVFEKCPVFGGKVKSANLEVVKRLAGVRDAFVIEGTDDRYGLMPGVAIVANSTWEAFKARQRLRVVWTEGEQAQESWSDHAARAAEVGKGPGASVVRNDGDVEAAFGSAAAVVEAEYSYPFVAHATLEPQNCTAQFKDGLLELWAPTQNPGEGRDLIFKTLGIPKDRIQVHLRRCGGGFGRRLFSDFMVEAAAIAMRVSAPVKLTWSREDDLRHDIYRAGGFHFLKGAVDNQGGLVAWKNHLVTFGHDTANPGNGAGVGGDELPARFIPNYRLEQTVFKTGVPMGWWRAPGSCVIAWVMQSFLDELAHAAKADPLAFRLKLLAGDKVLPGGGDWNPPYDIPRMRRVVEAVAEKAGWGKALPRGSGQGLAFHFSHMGYIAEVAEVTVSKEGILTVDRVVAVCDVGSQIVNLSGAENQVQGSIIDGLSVALHQELNIEKGAVVQANFNDYSLLRIQDAPRNIEVHFLKSDNPPTGLGEPALPPLAPAVCNAIFAATGKRIRSFPIASADLRWS